MESVVTLKHKRHRPAGENLVLLNEIIIMIEKYKDINRNMKVNRRQKGHRVVSLQYLLSTCIIMCLNVIYLEKQDRTGGCRENSYEIK